MNAYVACLHASLGGEGQVYDPHLLEHGIFYQLTHCSVSVVTSVCDGCLDIKMPSHQYRNPRYIDQGPDSI